MLKYISQAILTGLIIAIALNCFGQNKTKDHLITVNRDTLYDIKIRSNPYYTNKDQVTLKDGRSFTSNQVVSYIDGGEFYSSVEYEGNFFLMHYLNIGPSKIYVSKNSDESFNAYLSKSKKFYAIDIDNLDSSLKSHLDSVQQFEMKYKGSIPSKIKNPRDAAEYLASYNSFLNPTKYKPAKFKRFDLISIEVGLGAQLNTTNEPTAEPESSSQIAVVPQAGLRANYGLLAYGFDVEYISSSIGNEDIQTNLKFIPISLIAQIRLISSSSHSLYLLGGIYKPFDVGTKVKSTFRTNSSITRSTYNGHVKSAPVVGIAYQYKNYKNQRFSINYRYCKSQIDVEQPELINFAPETITYSSNSLKISYIIFTR